VRLRQYRPFVALCSCMLPLGTPLLVRPEELCRPHACTPKHMYACACVEMHQHYCLQKNKWPTCMQLVVYRDSREAFPEAVQLDNAAYPVSRAKKHMRTYAAVLITWRSANLLLSFACHDMLE
jgi:hypothetical protein